MSELARHFILIGASGSGKSETALRIAAGAARYGWKVFIIDGKGEYALTTRFVQVMPAVGKPNVACFPARPYDGWQGGPTSLLNRLMAVADFSEPYYRDVTKKVRSGTAVIGSSFRQEYPVSREDGTILLALTCDPLPCRGGGTVHQ